MVSFKCLQQKSDFFFVLISVVAFSFAVKRSNMNERAFEASIIKNSLTSL
jgi:hypothetical protein